MCESHAYLKKGDVEELLLEEVALVLPMEGGFRLLGLFGEEVLVLGKLLEINLLKHKILFGNGD